MTKVAVTSLMPVIAGLFLIGLLFLVPLLASLLVSEIGSGDPDLYEELGRPERNGSRVIDNFGGNSEDQSGSCPRGHFGRAGHISRPHAGS